MAYLQTKVDPILHPMTSGTFLAGPSDHIEFMMKYMQENHGKRPGINTNDRNELDFLRKEVARLKKELGVMQDDSDDEGHGKCDSDSELNSSEEDEQVADLI